MENICSGDNGIFFIDSLPEMLDVTFALTRMGVMLMVNDLKLEFFGIQYLKYKFVRLARDIKEPNMGFLFQQLSLNRFWLRLLCEYDVFFSLYGWDIA